jgi:lambda family phage minor tail protein L
MDKITAQGSIKNITSELFSLSPSQLVTMFVIDISDLGFNLGVINQTEITQEKDTKFYFHNTVNLTTKSIFWQGKEYIAAPINADGFEMNVKGSTPTPRLSMTVSDEGIPYLTRLKDRIYEMGDIVGAKVTRIRTFARFLDENNFLGQVPPLNFFPDPNSELPRDVFFIDRKSNENKNIIEYELAPAFELDGIKLPGRLVSSNSCAFTYRGEGCLYEYSSRINSDIHGDGTLPVFAPPVATVDDERVTSLITGVAFTDKGEYNIGQNYSKGEFCYIVHRGIKYYFISKINNNATQPPDSSVWVSDECSKKIRGCKLRWNNIADGSLPFGGFVSCTRFR